jgi:8-oxo-dGTP pyrophosphatase MutT (NUDIX family)
VSILLQHRAVWSHHGDTWGLPGGARDSHESAEEAALREAYEESGLDRKQVQITGSWVDDHGGWSYTTVLATAPSTLEVRAVTHESIALEWVAEQEVVALPLHPGFAASWPELIGR